MACRPFFEALPTGEQVSERAELIDKNHPDACCEDESVSQHSTGKVDNSEFAIRYIFSPIHLEADGSVNAAAFSDVADKGLSCERSPSPDAVAELHQRGEAQALAYNEEHPEKQPPRTYLGTVRALTADIRGLHYASKSRAFGVYDTGLPTNTEHIDVFQTLRGASRPEMKRLRKHLRDKFLLRGFAPKPSTEACEPEALQEEIPVQAEAAPPSQ